MLPFLLTSMVAGVAWGTAFTGSMRSLLHKTRPEDRAGILSTIFLISYSGAVLPNLIVGRVASLFSLFEIEEGYGLLVVAACLLTLVTAEEDDEQSLL